MEPMTLGSPVGSPVQTPGSPGPNSTYLPNFLLGDANPTARLNIMSPQGTPRNTQFGSITSGGLSSPSSNYCTPDYRTNRQKAMFGNVTSPSGPQISSQGQSGGPPTRGLFDTLETSQSMVPQSPSVGQNVTSNQSRVLTGSNLNNTLFLDSPANLSLNEPLQGLQQWVTVFGFPPNAINAVLSHISSRVRVVEKRGAPHAQGNWIHLKCASEQDAHRALACNGNIVSGSTMIGVVPCTDEGVVLGSEKDNLSKLSSGTRCFSTSDRINFSSPDYASSLPPTSPRIQNARPLAVGYNQHLSPQAVVMPQNVPQKSTGFFSKIYEYIW
ncbi:nucleoporin Nup35 [Neodiprion pinetum]|uniref:Nucleoporin NUP53 n=1 Tax=Neodiprion lecontei TaxID=441921 RepID=A0A6J0BI86_NEOLC|nr:nucleoporin Nup35 [Neodiprion lecontei]XP_046419536.1 nucleoporin Nup35 [Neodiprion fabricii]XP_046419537.1 nucleoporin Nup35 [Neodiprion fabricii]XP_046478324.1 nucleoporin Nup35 [Neodiprion pinetum]XP_046478325.1 nucleoporin Nup35 [Neodiprion pinetum]XP_046592066.1 nucleoporin Nup35 [Neodiprion lecontei]XP_046613270.1 nucleoporin Nup35 [Neodiprion virginianus]XP_046613271.1 nucleoporin Nup35 [Neodiprion virginianus]